MEEDREHPCLTEKRRERPSSWYEWRPRTSVSSGFEEKSREYLYSWRSGLGSRSREHSCYDWDGSSLDRFAPGRFIHRGPASEWWPRVVVFADVQRNAWRGARDVRAVRGACSSALIYNTLNDGFGWNITT